MLSLSGTPPRARFVREAGHLQISIDRRRGIGPAAFLLVWLGGWGLAAWSTVRTLLHESWSAGWALLAVWLAGWTIGGLTVVVLVLVLLLGNERVSVAGGALRLGVLVGPWLRERAFDLAGVHNLRVLSPRDVAPTARGRSRPPMGGLAFEHGGRTIRFGAGLQGLEADRVFSAIAALLPSG